MAAFAASWAGVRPVNAHKHDAAATRQKASVKRFMTILQILREFKIGVLVRENRLDHSNAAARDEDLAAIEFEAVIKAHDFTAFHAAFGERVLPVRALVLQCHDPAVFTAEHNHRLAADHAA